MSSIAFLPYADRRRQHRPPNPPMSSPDQSTPREVCGVNLLLLAKRNGVCGLEDYSEPGVRSVAQVSKSPKLHRTAYLNESKPTEKTEPKAILNLARSCCHNGFTLAVFPTQCCFSRSVLASWRYMCFIFSPYGQHALQQLIWLHVLVRRHDQKWIKQFSPYQ